MFTRTKEQKLNRKLNKKIEKPKLKKGRPTKEVSQLLARERANKRLIEEMGRDGAIVPQPQQLKALLRDEDEILFGGARGGGKTFCGQLWLLMGNAFMVKKYRALVIRRNADDLRDWIDRAQHMFSIVGAEVVGNPPEIKFPSGAIIRTGHLKDENAYSKYQGHEYQRILIEELTHIAREDDFEKLLGSNRSTCGIKPQVFCTTNPDGPGYAWVKKRWRIPTQPDGEVVTVETLPSGNTRSRVFLPSKVEDNPALIKADPRYVDFLDSIRDEDLRKAWREGDWSGMNLKGSYYGALINSAKKEGRITNVPYDLNHPVHTYWDLGVSDSTVVIFMQQVGREWHWIDTYETTGDGLPDIIRALQQKNYVYGNHYAPHDIEVRELGSGRSRLEQAMNLGIYFQVVPKGDVNDGINQVISRFNQLWISDKNEHFLEILAQYTREWNDKMSDWKDKPLHNHASHIADALRTWAMAPDPFVGQIKTRY